MFIWGLLGATILAKGIVYFSKPKCKSALRDSCMAKLTYMEIFYLIWLAIDSIINTMPM